MILIECTIAGLAVVIAACSAFANPKGGIFLSLAILLVAGGTIASIVTNVMARELANWPDGIKTADQISTEAMRQTFLVLIPCLILGMLSLWRWKKKLSNQESQATAKNGA